uniref:AAA+ ATPase domain-containing protein n=1 Tax=Cannabis sativa TaxID=3483 RepID=A0A803QA54_CANSA
MLTRPQSLASRLFKARWCVGDGSKIPILGEPWLPNEGNPQVVSYHPSLVNAFVNALMKIGELTWDDDVLNDLFEERYRDLIKAIPLNISRTFDHLVWSRENSGIYSVKSAYALLQKLKGHWFDESDDAFWCRLWQLKLPSKMQNLVWRACNNCLPTVVQLHIKRVEVSPICLLCHSEEETIIHALVTCREVKKCWDRVGIGTIVNYGASFFDWCAATFSNNSAAVNCRIVVVCWAVWGARNNLVWNNNPFIFEDVVAFAFRYLNQWKAAQMSSDSSWPILMAADVGEQWTPPAGNNVKVNVDAAVFDDGRSFGLGMVARSSNGLLLEGRMKYTAAQVDVAVAEAIGICEVLSWVKESQWPQVFIESDSLCVVQALHSSIDMISLFGSVIQGCKMMLASLNNVVVSFVKRSANVVAHKFARAARLYPDRIFSLESVPTELLLCLTSLVRAVVQECGAHIIVISPHSVHKSHAGESEKFLREAFAEASSHAKSGKPSVIFIDEIDALCPRRDSRKEQDVRISSQLLILMDSNKSSVSHVVVVASTNRVDAIDPALRRSGRFDAEIEVTTPNEEERFQILKLYTKKIPMESSIDLKAIAASCNGFVGADLEALCREAAWSASKRSSDANEDDVKFRLTMEDWNHARSVVGPSITRGVTVEIPNVTWEDIGGLKDLKKKLQQAVEWPIKHSNAFTRFGISPMRGILLHGPPGCSKTTLAKAAAHAAQASFFSLSGAELFSMYVGDGEALLRNTFRRARLAAPSIIFFDEADVVAGKRGASSSSNSTVSERLLSTLLTEMDGLEEAKGILVLAATNRPYAIDDALMRPGRFDLVLYVPPPDLEARCEILQVHTRKMRISDDVDLSSIAEDTELFTGAELESLCREAGMVALREDISATVVCDHHFQTVKKSLKPALTKETVLSYSCFMKGSSGTVSNKFESNAEHKNKRHESLGIICAMKIGVLSLVFAVAMKYFLTSTGRTRYELATT